MGIVEPDRFTKWVQAIVTGVALLRAIMRHWPSGWLGAIAAGLSIVVAGIIAWGKMRPK